MLKQLQQTALLLLFLMGVSKFSFGTNDPVYTNSLFGRDGMVKKDSSVSIIDGNYYTYGSRIEKTYAIKNIVMLAIDEESPFYIQTNFDVKVYLQITTKDTNGVITSFPKLLQVNYSKDSGAKYNAIAYHVFNGGIDVTIKIDSIVTAANWDISKVLKLKNEIQSQRDWKFTCTTTVPSFKDSILENQLVVNIPDGTMMDERTVKWGVPEMMVNEYDLEWAWIDESAVQSYYTNNLLDLQKIFDNNATRISTTKWSYRIPFLYDGVGRLFVRIRATQLKADGRRLEGDWIYGNGGTLYYTYTGHVNGLNWQATTSYAEEGKRKSVVQYFDGSLRGRQTVTKDNTTGTTVVAETMYDYQGRPVIQVLPAPTINTILSYTKNFNQFDDTRNAKSVYDKLDMNQGPCSQVTKKLLAASGASQYYSPQNPEINVGANRFIPDAEGYPYTETRYTADGSGRVDAQGGLGTTFQINSGRETKYFYETPHQDELDGLFGTDAGIASHYSKNWIKDANGQYSISYVDMHGRTVATALSGNKPANLDALPSYTNAYKTVTRQLIDNETNYVSGNSIIMSKPLMVAASGNYTFNYSLSPDKLQLLNCNNQVVCYDCLYELNISLIPDCSTTTIPFTNPLVKKNFTLGQYLTQCTANGKSPSLDTSFTIANLPEGSYTIVKELKLNKDAQKFYRDSIYKTNNTCKTLEQFISTQYSITGAQQHCAVTCASCNATLGTLAQFTNRFAMESQLPAATIAAMANEILVAYNQALANCARICNNETDDGFDQIRSIKMAMLEDMSPPNGQYAKLNEPTNPYNIFNANVAGSLQCTANPSAYCTAKAYTRPRDYDLITGAVSGISVYKDKFNISHQALTNAVTTGLYLPQQFVDSFQAPYANQLLWAHPEFRKLNATEVNLRSTYRFEAMLNNTDTWADAMSKGYITNLLAKDSFFMDNGKPGWQYLGLMQNAMNVNHFTDPDNNCNQPFISIWKMAQFSVFCLKTLKEHPTPAPTGTGCQLPAQEVLDCFNTLSNSYPSEAGHCTADMNIVWRNFKSFYLSYRKALISKYLNAVSIGVPTTRDLQDAHFQPRFITVVAPNTAGGYNFNTDINDLLNSTNPQDYTNAVADQADSTCRANAGNWILKLRQCSLINAYANAPSNLAQWQQDSIWLIKNLVAVCKTGVDYMGHPFGASSMPSNAVSVPDDLTGIQFRDFPQIVQNYLQRRGFLPISGGCNQFLINYPAAYENAPPLVNQEVITKPSECECERITTFKLMWEQSNYQGTFATYLQNVHHSTISPDTLNILMQMCATGQTGNNCVYLDKPIKIPPIFTCRGTSSSTQTCITCNDYANLKTGFTAATGLVGPLDIPTNQTQININHAFQDYANYKTGFTKTWAEYVEFGLKCATDTGYQCHSLDSLVALFNVSPLHAANPSGIACQNAFAQFMNQALGQGFNYDEWVAIFIRSCGHGPNVCQIILTCELLTQYVDSFYTYYGVTIYTNANSTSLFSTFMNGVFSQNYSYGQYVEFNKLCHDRGCNIDWDIPAQFNSFLLNRFYIYFSHLYPNPSSLLDCQGTFTTAFNNYFSTDFIFSDIQNLYYTLIIAGCKPNIDELCTPPFSCGELSDLLQNFYALNGIAISSSPNCSALFLAYFNEHMNTTYTSFTQLQTLYNTICNTQIIICEQTFDCKTIMGVLGLFTQTSYPPGTCQVSFVTFFNNTLFASYSSYQELQDLYKKVCQYSLSVCDGGAVLIDVAKLQDVKNDFVKRYPTPVEELGLDNAKQIFTGMFNDAFNTKYSYAQVNNNYFVLTGDSLHVFEGKCATLTQFVNSYQAKYGNIKLPLAARQDLFAYMYNKVFYNTKGLGTAAVSVATLVDASNYTTTEKLVFEEIKKITNNCNNLLPANLQNETGVYSLNDPLVLTAYKSIYYLIHPEGIPLDCEADFANWVNRTANVQLDYNKIAAKYDANLGIGSGYICSRPSEIKSITLEAYRPGPIGPPTPPVYYTGPILCGLNTIVYEPPVLDTAVCKLDTSMILTTAIEKYELYKDSLRNIFDVAYRAKCLSARYMESFTVTYGSADYHYTLYYYDQAGNLVKTVPPAGVDDRTGNTSFVNQVKQQRLLAQANGPSLANRLVPSHTLFTSYRYNTLNQVVMQTTPDAGNSNFYYDALGRLVVSQNAKQQVANNYSYTLYDGLGRINEVGQVSPSVVITQEITRNPQLLAANLVNKPAEQITRMFYDKTYFDGNATLCPDQLCQENLRNRMSYTAVFATGTIGITAAGTHDAATFYDYDMHGNVKNLLQDYNSGAMKATGNRFKKMTYDYDLISGKVNTVSYQPNQPDAFYHRYSYDGDNRTTDVETSNDKIIWEKDAQYRYYKHGSLSRVVLGQQQVQGIDYAYNLQGWLKGINSTNIGDGSFDIGGDGKIGAANTLVARDAYGISLNYFNGDYKTIGINIAGFVNPFASINVGADLFNGNIKSQLVNLPKLGDAITYSYGYDQLNRLTKMDAYNGLNNATNTFTPININDYKERLTYDPNGNIETYLRNGTGSTMNLNNYSYTYIAGKNQLSSITNTAPANAITKTYAYDLIGNTTGDGMQGMTNAMWNVYGKLQSTTNKDGVTVTYTYSTDGQRIGKKIGAIEEWYVKDASGNEMASYKMTDSLRQIEVQIYGNNKLASLQTNVNMQRLPSNNNEGVLTRNNKGYLLNNYKGDIVAIVSDVKVAHSSSGNTIDWYLPQVLTATYFSSYGAIAKTLGLPQSLAYNGQRKSTEISTDAQTALFWEYNGDVGRRGNLDPKSTFGISDYSVFMNNPIKFTDNLGDSVPATFTTPSGQPTNVIPEVVQQQFQKEYGITLGYANGKLFKAGDYETDQTVSEAAKSEWETVLGSSNTEEKLVFGYKMGRESLPGVNGKLIVQDPIIKGRYSPSEKTAFIDLGDFEANGNIISRGIVTGSNSKSLVSSATMDRIENLARVIEHEFIGHAIKKLEDKGFGNLGAVENLMNYYREQMGVPTRDSYQYSTDTKSKPDLLRMTPMIHQVGKMAHDNKGNTYEVLYDLRKLEVANYLF